MPRSRMLVGSSLLRSAARWLLPWTLLSVLTETGLSQEPPTKLREIPGGKQFDFWVGEWELTWPSGAGKNRISFTLDSAVIMEEFSGEESMALRGMSVSVFDARAGTWRQTWVDNQGGYLDFEGEFKDGRMILQRSATVQEKSVLQRMVWDNITADSLDWSWERSDDQGQTWKTLWPIHYKRKR